tara:strand:- start:13045 stop:13308 length:264 start_codon:yes stop_codon:yes gene_type:complete
MKISDKPIAVIERLKFGRKLMSFGMNYPHNFIEKVWAHEPFFIKSFQTKFSIQYAKHGTLAFYKWYFDLSDNNKMILMDWIETNYKN